MGQESLRERLLSRGFHEQFLGDDRPPVTHYQLGDRDAGFYAEFLTPLVGGEFRRDDTRDVTATIAGITAQKLRYLDVLLIAPWSVSLPVGGDTGQPAARINIANPVSYIVQKLLVSGKRKPGERAKDVLYIHDTLELFGRSSSSLKDLWADRVRPELGRRSEAKALRARRQLFNAITDTVREGVLTLAQAGSACLLADSDLQLMLRLCGAAKQGNLPDTRRVLNSCISTVNGAPSITARILPLVTIIMNAPEHRGVREDWLREARRRKGQRAITDQAVVRHLDRWHDTLVS